jgi:hypothetical protein
MFRSAWSMQTANLLVRCIPDMSGRPASLQAVEWRPCDEKPTIRFVAAECEVGEVSRSIPSCLKSSFLTFMHSKSYSSRSRISTTTRSWPK